MGLQDCPLPAFKCVNPPQRPYTLCCWGVKPFAGLQTRQPSAAALHILLVGVQECRLPASAPKRFFKPLNFRSGPPDCLVEALSVPFAGLQTRQPSAAALHILLVGAQECRLPASAPKRFFKPLNFRSGPPDCLVEALSVPFAGLQTAQPSAAALHSTVLFKRLNPPQRRYTHCLVEGSRLQTPKRSAAALHTVLLTLQGYRLRASQPLTHCLVGAAKVPAFKPLNAPQRPYTVFC